MSRTTNQLPAAETLAQTLVASVGLTKVSNHLLNELRFTPETFTVAVGAEIDRRNALNRAESARIAAKKTARMSVAEMNRRLFGATGLGGK